MANEYGTSEVIHGNGSKVIAQISHAGSASSRDFTGFVPISASAIPNSRTKGKEVIVPEEMTHEKIADVVRDFAKAANRVKEAGFDGVEIHSAYGYLLNQFYSPLMNHEADLIGVGRAIMKDRLWAKKAME